MSTKNKKTRTYNSIVRQKQAADTKKRIADAAEELMQNSGYEYTTIDAIAKKAGVATQTIYSIFRSKQGILMYLLSNSLEAVELELTSADIPKCDNLSEIAQLITERTSKHGQQQTSILNAVGGLEVLYPELHSLVEESSRRRRKIIENAIRESLQRHSSTLSASKRKTLTDIIWTFTDDHFYYSLVELAGWPISKYEILFHKIMETVLRDLAPEMLDILDE